MSEHEPQATPEQEAQVRRLLARARHDEPLPPDVASRLDQVLAGLAAERPRGMPPPPPPPNVVDLASRRRRRVAGLLVAAAAVVAVGVGLGQVLGDSGDDSGDNESASESNAGSADLGRNDDDQAGDAAPPDASPPSLAETRRPGAAPSTDMPDPIAFDPADFETVARRLQGTSGFAAAEGEMVDGPQLSDETGFRCEPAMYGEGELIPVRYEGAPAVLAYRPPAGQTQTVEVLQCGTAVVLRSTTLPVD